MLEPSISGALCESIKISTFGVFITKSSFSAVSSTPKTYCKPPPHPELGITIILNNPADLSCSSKTSRSFSAAESVTSITGVSVVKILPRDCID